ncbi:MAG: endo-1,4-beta-xylanase, partial [Myxococcales bacterium]
MGGSTADAGGGADAGVAGPTDAGGGMTDVGDGPPEKFCGNITTLGMVRSDFIDYWDQITPENEGKWGSVEPVRDQMSWGGLDAAYEYARQHGIPFKQHTFVWGSQQPGWIAGLPANEQREEVEEWIRLYCERYPDTDMIDVVNEPPPHTTPPYAEALGGAGDSGYDWIVQSFVWARQYCPNAVLILNDYNTIEWPGDNEHFIDIVNRILAAGAPIDAIGAQA